MNDTQKQILAMLANGINPAQISAVFPAEAAFIAAAAQAKAAPVAAPAQAPAQAPAGHVPGNPAQYLAGAMGSTGLSDHGQGFKQKDPNNDRSHTGAFDGTYACEIVAGAECRRTDSGDVFVVPVKVIASNNEAVRVGDVREVDCWPTGRYGADELSALVQAAWAGKGNPGQWNQSPGGQAFYASIWNESQGAIGATVEITASTAPKVNKPHENYTKVRMKARTGPVATAPVQVPATAPAAGLDPAVLAALAAAGQAQAPAMPQPTVSAPVALGNTPPAGLTPEMLKILYGQGQG